MPQFTVLLIGQGVALKVKLLSHGQVVGCCSEGITGSLLWLIGVSLGYTIISL